MYKDQIRDILARHGRLSVDIAQISDDGDLYQAGTNLVGWQEY
jgi:hypothetical protein